MKGLKLFTMPLLAICMALSGCVVLESTAMTGRSGSGKNVTTSASDFGILGLSLPSGLTSAANSQLVGAVSGRQAHQRPDRTFNAQLHSHPTLRRVG